MDDKVKVVVLGTGQMGSGMIKLLLQKYGVDLVGVYGRRASRVGMDVGKALGLDTAIGGKITHDLPGLLEQTKPHVAMQATCSRVVEAVDAITAVLQHRANVIAIVTAMASPAYQAPHLATAMHHLAAAHQVPVVGTGMHPGFGLDLLRLARTGVCGQVASMPAQRLQALAPSGPSVLTSQGVGRTPEAFPRGGDDGSGVGPGGLPASISLIATA